MSVASIIDQAARQYGLDPQAMLRIAQLESGMRPGAKNPNSSASGLFQFINPTWKQYGQGDPMDARANTDAAGRYLTDVQKHLSGRLGRAPEPWELYLGHQQGMGGASALLARPEARAVEALTSVYGSAAAARRAIALNIPSGSGAHPDTISASDFAGLWRARFNRTRPNMSTEVANSADPNAPLQSDLLDPLLEAAEQPVLDPVETGLSIAQRLQDDHKAEPMVCPEGSYYDPALQACIPVPEDDKRFGMEDASNREKSSPIDRFESIFDALPDGARIRA